MNIEKIVSKHPETKLYKLNDGISLMCNDEKLENVSNEMFIELLQTGKIKKECETTRGQIYSIL